MPDFKEFRKNNHLTQKDAADFFRCTQGFISQIEKGIRPIPIEFISKAMNALNGWDVSALLVSSSDMLKPPFTPAPLNATANYRLVPMYNMDARGGFESNEVVDATEYVVDRIPFKDARQDDICVMITGNSMAPTYCAGSVVLLHPIDRWREFLELGQVYVIILEDGRRLIKELRTSEEDKKSNYLCRSHNPDVDPVELPKSMIRKVFIVAAMYSKTIL